MANGSDTPSPSPASPEGPSGPTGKIDKLANTAHKAIDQIADKAEPARGRLHAGVDQAATAMKDRTDRLGRTQDEWVESLRSCVRDHPIASITTAVAVGVLIDKLLSRR